MLYFIILMIILLVVTYLGIFSAHLSSLCGGGSNLLATPSSPAAIVTAIMRYGLAVPLGILFSIYEEVGPKFFTLYVENLSSIPHEATAK